MMPMKIKGKNNKMNPKMGTPNTAKNSRDPQISSSKSNKDAAEGIELKDHEHMKSIFPEKLWRRILEKVKNPKNLEILSNSNSYFRELLSPQKLHFLFHSVWPILEKRYKKKSRRRNIRFYNPDQQDEATDSDSCSTDPNDNDGYIHGSRNEPILFQERKDEDSDSWTSVSDDAERFGKFVPYKKVIGLSSYWTVLRKLRFVCRSWNGAIESFYQDHPQHFQLEYEPGATWNQDLTTALAKYSFCEIGRVRQFLLQFGSTHGNTGKNPFFGRSASFALPGKPTAEVQAFDAEIDHIIAAYGHHLWYCKLSASDFPTLTACYSRIRQVLLQMPNLKVLDLYSVGLGILTKEMVDRLKAEMSLNPLPTFDGLQMIRPINLCPPIFKELLRSNDQVPSLNMLWYIYIPQLNYLYKVPLPKLKVLEMKVNSTGDFRHLVDPQLNWPLKKLRLDFEPNLPFIKWQYVFRLLEKKWAGTLTHLEVTMPKAHEKEDKDQVHKGLFRLKLPHLIHLKLTMKNVTCLDFLLAMKDSIVDLDLNVRRVVRCKSNMEYVDNPHVEDDGIIKLFSLPAYSERLSNIGQLFPKLKRCHIFQTFGVLETEDKDILEPYPDPIEITWEC